MAALCLDICNYYYKDYNVFFDNCNCEDCKEKEESRNSNFFENQQRVDTETSSEFKSIGVEENLRPKPLDEISEMETGVSEKSQFHVELQEKEIGKFSKKSFECLEEGCNMTFNRKDSLSRHSRTHSGDQPFSCTLVCKKNFSTRRSRDRHMQNKVCTK